MLSDDDIWTHGPACLTSVLCDGDGGEFGPELLAVPRARRPGLLPVLPDPFAELGPWVTLMCSYPVTSKGLIRLMPDGAHRGIGNPGTTTGRACRARAYLARML